MQPFQLFKYQWREDRFEKQTANARPLQFMTEATSKVQAANTIALCGGKNYQRYLVDLKKNIKRTEHITGMAKCCYFT